MGWVYLDDQFPDHPKVAAAGGDAAWLFVCGLAYCKRYNTAGAIPAAQVAKLTDRRGGSRLAARLVEVRLWEATDGGFQVHDYADWNRPSESRSEAGRKGAAARWGDRNGNANGSANGNGNATASVSRMAQDAHIPNPIPIPLLKDPPPTNGCSRPNDGGGGLLEKAIDLVVERQLASSRVTVTNPAGWRRAARKSVAALANERLACENLDDPGWTVENLADYLHPPSKPPADPPESARRDYDHERPDCERCEGSGWIDDEGVAFRCDHQAVVS